MSEKDKIISLSATGIDTPGLVSKITNRIYELGGNIIDVEENCRRGLFSIFLIIDFSGSEHHMEQVEKALTVLGDETGLKTIFGAYEEAEIRYPARKERHIATILGEDKPGIIAKVSAFFHAYNINIETCKMIARGKFFSMEMGIDTGRILIQPGLSRDKTIEKMKSELKELCRDLNQSVVIQSEDVYRKGKKLVVFDVESTLIQESSIKSFPEKVCDQIRPADTKLSAVDNAGDSVHALIENARLLKGMPIADFEKFSSALELNPGALELIGILKSMGFKIALLSSGFNFFIRKIFEEAGVDYAFSNTLKTDDKGLITGELEEPVITSDKKQEILEFIMRVENLQPDQVIAVGDGSIRSHFIKNVGLSIAFKPDEKSIETDGVLSSDQIINMLYCLGMPKAELDKYLKTTHSQSPTQV